MTQRSSANPANRIAIVTGGSRGLGRSTVLSLARHRVGSIFTYHANRAEAEKAAETAQGYVIELQSDRKITAHKAVVDDSRTRLFEAAQVGREASLQRTAVLTKQLQEQTANLLMLLAAEDKLRTAMSPQAITARHTVLVSTLE
jgi:NAD(P)-dependent dehydrogenase (short-subunit alcohol dehydrogenase family)